eukprot:gene15824-21946_t
MGGAAPAVGGATPAVGGAASIVGGAAPMGELAVDVGELAPAVGKLAPTVGELVPAVAKPAPGSSGLMSVMLGLGRMRGLPERVEPFPPKVQLGEKPERSSRVASWMLACRVSLMPEQYNMSETRSAAKRAMAQNAGAGTRRAASGSGDSDPTRSKALDSWTERLRKARGCGGPGPIEGGLAAEKM